MLPEPEYAYPWEQLGTAFDYRMRYFFDVTPARDLIAFRGAQNVARNRNSKRDTPRAFDELSDLIESTLNGRSSSATGLSREDEETWLVLVSYWHSSNSATEPACNPNGASQRLASTSL